MFGIFWNCNFLTSLDVSNWDTSKVTDMSGIFSGCNSLTSLDVSKWNTSKVTDMSWMFYNCNSLASITGTLDLTSCTKYSYNSMLDYTDKLTSITVHLPSSITQSDFESRSGVKTSVTKINYV